MILSHAAALTRELEPATASQRQSAMAEAPQTHTSRSNIVFVEDFDSTNSLARWLGLPKGMALVSGPNGLALSVSRTTNSEPRSVMTHTSLSAERLRGCKVRCEAQVRATNVAQPSNSWNGIKVMLHTESPSEGNRWDQQNNLFGTFDWRSIRFVTSIPEDATLVQLSLGLENTSGQVLFDDVKVSVLRDPRDTPAVAAHTGPVFKGHGLPRLRGAMVAPGVSAESLRVLGEDWKANLIRWQLIRSVPPGKETTLAEYDAWLDGELGKLDRLLPNCAQFGLRVVIDLHSPPGGTRTVSGYIGSDSGLFTNKAAQGKFVQVWQKMAQRYRDNSTIWGFDLANEPVEEGPGDDCDDWQTLATRAAQSIRALDEHHAIIVEPSPWGSPASIRNLAPLPVEGIVYSVHMYVPFEFTHQGIYGNASGLNYPGILKGRPLDKAVLRRTFAPVLEFQRKNNVHIYIGEFSAIRWAPGAAHYLRDCIDLLEENGWDWSYHAFREWQGWSVEHGSDAADARPATTVTDRQRLLLEWFARNVRP